jgi:hypothetical protein
MQMAPSRGSENDALCVTGFPGVRVNVCGPKTVAAEGSVQGSTGNGSSPLAGDNALPAVPLLSGSQPSTESIANMHNANEVADHRFGNLTRAELPPIRKDNPAHMALTS